MLINRHKWQVNCNYHGISIHTRYSKNYKECKKCIYEYILIKEFKKKFKNFDYIKTPILDIKKPITISCKIHGEYTQTIRNIRQSPNSMGCKKCLSSIKSTNSLRGKYNDKNQKICKKCNKYKDLFDMLKNNNLCKICYYNSSGYINSQKKYKMGHKFINNYCSKKCDLNWYNCNICNKYFVSKIKLRTLFKFCKNCKKNNNTNNFIIKNTNRNIELKEKLCIDCNNKYSGHNNSIRCEICRDINKIIVRQNYYKTQQYKITRKNGAGDHKHRAKKYKVPYVKFDKWNDVFVRDNFICQYCGIVCDTNKKNFQTKKYITIDCIIPMSKGGAYEPSNCVTACRSCNSKKRDKLNILPNKFSYKSKQLPLF